MLHTKCDYVVRKSDNFCIPPVDAYSVQACNVCVCTSLPLA